MALRISTSMMKMLWKNFDFFPPQKFFPWNCYHFCWVKNIIMMSFRHILFWVFCTEQKLHTTGIPIPIDLVHFSETPKNWTARTMDRPRNGWETYPFCFFGSSQKLDGPQVSNILHNIAYFGVLLAPGRWTDPVHFLEAPKNRTERMMDRPYCYFALINFHPDFS